MRAYYTCVHCRRTAMYKGSPLWAQRCFSCGRPVGRRSGTVLNISTTIKRVYLDQVLLGRKTCELKASSKYWNSRLEKIMAPLRPGDCFLTYLCGKDVNKFEVVAVDYLLDGTDIDGIFCQPHWRIDLGPRLCPHEDSGCGFISHAATMDGLDLWRCIKSGNCPYRGEIS